MLFFILEGVAQTSSQTVALVQGVKELMQVYKHRMRDELPKIYSHTARKYLDEVVSLGLLEKHKNGVTIQRSRNTLKYLYYFTKSSRLKSK